MKKYIYILIIWNIIITILLFTQFKSNYLIFSPIKNNQASRIYAMPNGVTNGVSTKLELFGNEYKIGDKNYSALNILVYPDTIHIGPNSNGNMNNPTLIIGGKYIGSKLDKNSDFIEFSNGVMTIHEKN